MVPTPDTELMNEDPLTSHLRILNYIITPLSLIGVILMLVFCIRSSSRGLSFQLICTLAICDLLYTLTNAMNFFEYNGDSIFCKIEANTRGFFFVLSCMIATAIAVLHYKLSILTSDLKKSKFFAVTMIVAITLSFACKAGPLYSNNISVMQWRDFACFQEYTPTSDEITVEEVIFGIFLNALPALAGPLLTLMFYILARRRFRRASVAFGGNLRMNNTMFLLPTVLFLTLLPYFVITILRYCTTDEIPDWLLFMSFLTTRSLGLINSITYGMQRRIYWKRRKQMSDSTIGFRFQDLSDMTFDE